MSVTTAGTADGTGWFDKQMLLEAKSQGFTPDNFSIMPFDGGFDGGAASQIDALTDFHQILQSTFGWDEATAWAHEGFSGMNGRSDTGEYFTQDDFRTVLDFATGHHMDRFTFWSLNRDRQCSPPDNGGRTSGTCSSVPQDSWDFATFSVTFAGATPPSTTPTDPTPPAGTECKPAWDPATACTGGSEVSYDGHNWKAKWWTQNETPVPRSGVRGRTRAPAEAPARSPRDRALTPAGAGIGAPRPDGSEPVPPGTSAERNRP